jgi:2-dehydropantoate 2-reductase
MREGRGATAGEQVRIGLVGAGAVGTILAGALLDTDDTDVRLIWVVRNPAKRRALDLSAITFAVQGTDATIIPRISTTDPRLEIAEKASDLRDFRLGILITAVKAYDYDAVARDLSPLTTQPTLAVQNGWFDRNDAALGVLVGGSYFESETSVVHSPTFSLAIGWTRGGCDGLEPFQGALARPYFDVALSDDIAPRMVEKMAVNAVANPISALADAENAALTRPEVAPIVERTLAEIADVAQSRWPTMGLTEGALNAKLGDVLARTGLNFSSMLMDVRAGRRTEIDFLNAVIAKWGDECGIPAPVNKTLVETLRAWEEGMRGD